MPKTAKARGGAARRASGALAALCLLGGPLAALPQVAPDEPEEPGQEVRSFAIPETSVARALFERARTHAAAKRWNEAIADLQTLIVEHAGEVLSGSFGGEGEGWRSQQPVHHGAAAAAERLLAELPEPGRRLYLERYGPEAAAALARARASGERDALARVARRYPLTPAAREAWWSLGDFEFELGEHEAARAAWQRAARATREAGLELGPGAQQRLELVFPAEGEGEGEAGAATAASAPELALPGAEAQSWRVRVDEAGSWYPFHVGYRGGGFNMLPLCTDDRVLVSNSLRLFAFDAWSGRELWRSAEAPGWDDVDLGRAKDGDGDTLRRLDFFHAVDHTSVLIAPAASERIAVAALQIPVSQVGNKRYQRIPITTVIPDRRLFAFDLSSGEPLWNHMPPRDWDGESGEFATRMRVAGPPVVAGSRVLVPAYRLQGRIEYHVACYDLGSGALLWSTALISGQVSLNMFGRQSREFAAAPLVVQGERVLALTQLGAMAALDLYTGDILWETLYDSLPLPRNEYGLDTPTRPQRWNNSAPLLEGNVVLATPLDSNDLIALDAESGALLWSCSWRSLVTSRSSSERWTLLGADEQTVYLSGTSIVACRAPAGLAGPRPPSEFVFSPPISSENPPRAAFGERWIVAPTAERRVVFDRLNLRAEDRLLSLPWGPEQEEGNASLHGGALYTLSGKNLTGTFDWRIQERRFEDALAREPGDHGLALAYAGLLVDRAGVALRAAELPRALAHLRRAETELEARLHEQDQGVRTRAEAGLFRALTTEAQVLILQADSNAALARLERARELAGTPLELRDTLLELARLRRVRQEPTERLALLDELETSCGDLPLPVPGADEPGAAEFDPSPAVGTRSVALWANLERAAIHARSKDASAELEVLHAVLARWGDVTLAEAESAPKVSERIATLLEQEGAQAYAPFEGRARAALDAALAHEDGAALERVVALYPHSEAAHEAVRARRDQAWRAGEPEVLARLLQEQAPAGGRAPGSDDDTALGLVQLAALLRRAGNVEFEAGLLAELARERGELVPEEPPGPSLGERARLAQLAAAPRVERAESTFDAENSLTPERLLGRWTVLGPVPRRAADDTAEELMIVSGGEDRGRRTLMALRAVAGAKRAWMQSVERGRGVRSGPDHLLTADALVLVDAGGLVALDPDGGLELWRRNFGGEAVISLAGASGVAVVGLESPDTGERLAAFDAVSGVPLWQHALPRGGGTWAPLVGENACVVLPRQAESAPALVLELFTGRERQRLTLENDVGEADRRGAWIRDGRLLLPGFPHAGARAKPCLIAYELDSGRSAWRVGPLEGHDLDSIVRHGRDAYLVLFGLSFAGAPAGSVLQLDTRLGAVRPVPGAEPSPNNTPVGVRRAEVVEIDEPYLYLIATGGGRECLLRALHLPYGERWQQHVAIPPGELYDDLPPLPAQTRSSLVMAFADSQRSARAAGGGRVNLQIFDRASGVPRDWRPLDDIGRAQNLELVPFGPSLLVVGTQALVVLSKEQK